MTPYRSHPTPVLILVTALLNPGCAPKPQASIRMEAIPIQNAIAIVNNNLDKFKTTLRATGSVDGTITLSSGKQRNFHLDGILFYLAPNYLRFDLKKFGERQILIGSNEQHYWYYSKEHGEYFCGRHEVAEDWPENIPVRPDQLIDAIGFSPIVFHPSQGSSSRLVQRIENDYQQLFLIHDDDGISQIAREYWLDRAAPRLLRRVIFRNAEGGVDMSSELDHYIALSPDGPRLPRTLTVYWPATKTRLRFRVGRWRLVPGVGPDGPQFASPKACNR